MFIEAAERASFAAAAEALNVTQAAVSKQMAGLEANLSTVLFERAHRSVTVTAAGRTSSCRHGVRRSPLQFHGFSSCQSVPD